MRKTLPALMMGLLITCAAPAALAQPPQQAMSDAELAAVSGTGLADPMMTMMANMMVVMSGMPVVGPIHKDMMAAINHVPVLGPLHMRIMSHATLGGSHMDHAM